MKVLCTNSEWEHENFWDRLREKLFGAGRADPIEGHIYTVTRYEAGYYTLEEFGNERYRFEWFIPVDEVSYTAVKKEKILEPSLN